MLQNTYALWTIGLALAYTFILIVSNRRIAKNTESKAGSYFVGNRNFNAYTVAFCITGLFSGSSFIAIMELSYQTGISAIWYGVAETVQILLIALLLIKPLRKKLVVTVSGLIGDTFGRRAKFISGLITAITFPMWSVSTAIAFAFALHAFVGVSIYVAIVFTAVLLFIFLSAGGMRSLAFTQTLNCALFTVMAIIGVVAFFINPGISGYIEFLSSEPVLKSPFSVGTTIIIAWFGTFIVNVILAQAVFQMSLSCKTPEEGQKGLYLAAVFGIPFILVGVILGTAAASFAPNEGLGLLAVPLYLADILPAPLTGLFFLGVWACALGWAGPCQFSGATSLGRDVGSALNPQATEAQLVKYTRYALVFLTALMVLYAFLRAKDAAWWNILAWTLRNGTTLSPVVVAFFWPLANKRAVLISMLAGFGSGLAWYNAGAWSSTEFYLNLHPVWVGMSTNLATVVIVTLLTSKWHLNLQALRGHWGGGTLLASLVLWTGTISAWPSLQGNGFGGLTLFLSVLAACILVFKVTVKTEKTVALGAAY